MSDEEIAAFLDEERTLIVATVGADGMPHLAPMWFAVIDDAISFWTYAKSQKVVNLARDPRMTLLVEAGVEYSQLRGVSMRGVATIVRDRDEVQRIGELISARYGGALDDEQRARVRAIGAKRVAVTFVAERVASWDHRKLDAGVY